MSIQRNEYVILIQTQCFNFHREDNLRNAQKYKIEFQKNERRNQNSQGMILHLRLTLAKSLRYFIIKQIALYKARIFLMLHNQYSKYLKMKNIVKAMLLIAITLALLSQISAHSNPPSCSASQYYDSCHANGGRVCVNKVCVNCTNNAQCLSSGKVCSSGRCAEPTCTSNANCVAPKKCLSSKCRQCITSTDCTGGKVCSSSQVCVQCISNSNCIAGNFCYNSKCVQCTSNSDCSYNPKGPTCSSTGQCGCTSSAQCTVDTYGPTCTSGFCQCATNTNCDTNTNGPTCLTDSFGKYCGCASNANCASKSAGTVCRQQIANLTNFDDRTTCGCTSSSDITSCASTNRLCSPVRLVCYCDNSKCQSATPATPFCSINSVFARESRCVQCATNSQCPIPKGNCSNNVCLQCNSNSDCTGVNKACLLSSGICVACVVNSDCTGANTVCTSSNVCVQCVVNSDCPASKGNCSSNVCLACNQNSDCSNFQSCNLATSTCQCSNARCNTAFPGFLCSAETAAGTCDCNAVNCTGISGICINDQETKCAITCANTGSFETTECPTGQFCHNDLTNTVCRSSSISCLNGNIRDSTLCPSEMYCQAANTGTDSNSATCVPLCDAVNNFCKGFDCPAGFPYAIAGVPCARDADDTVDVCSCLAPAP